MAYPARRGGNTGWSLVQLAADARVSRWAARQAVTRALIGTGPYTETDIVLLRVASACLTHPGPSGLTAGGLADVLDRRDRDAIRFTRAYLADPGATAAAAVLLSSRDAVAADSPADLRDGLLRLYPDAVLVLPVGGWRLSLSSITDAARSLRALPDSPW